MNNNFASNLKKIRKENNLSQEDLAEMLGVSRQAISKWESSLAYPEMDKILALCDKFNLNIDDLLHKDIKEVKGEQETKKNLNKYINDFLKFITDTINLFSNMNFKSKIKCLFEQVIIIIILFILGLIIFSLGQYLFGSIIQKILPEQIYYILDSIILNILTIFIIIISLIIFIHIFKTRYLDYYNKLKQSIKEENNEKDINNKILFKQNEKKIIIRDPINSDYKFINGLFKLFIIGIKCFALCFSLLLCLTLIGLFSLFIISFLVFKTGLFFIGLIGALLSSAIIDIILILIIFNFVFNRKNDKKKMIYTFISSLIVFGISCGLIFIGFLKFNVVDKDNSMLKKETIEFEMKDDLFFDIHYDIEYEEIDSDDIKLEYKIYKSCDVKTYNNYGIQISGYCSNSLKLLREYINSINNKKIVNINNEIKDVKVYASKENIEKLKNNKKEYENMLKNYQFNLDSYEEEIGEYQEKINELEEQLNLYEKIDEED